MLFAAYIVFFGGVVAIVIDASRPGRHALGRLQLLITGGVAVGFALAGALGLTNAALNEGTPATEPLPWILFSLLLLGGLLATAGIIGRAGVHQPHLTMVGAALVIAALALPSTLTLAMPLSLILLYGGLGATRSFGQPDRHTRAM